MYFSTLNVDIFCLEKTGEWWQQQHDKNVFQIWGEAAAEYIHLAEAELSGGKTKNVFEGKRLVALGRD